MYVSRAFSVATAIMITSNKIRPISQNKLFFKLDLRVDRSDTFIDSFNISLENIQLNASRMNGWRDYTLNALNLLILHLSWEENLWNS